VIKHRYRNGVHATHNNTVNAGTSIITGHLAFAEGYAVRRLLTAPDGGVDTGTLADADGPQFNDYMEDNPANWRSGFAVLTIKDEQLLWPRDSPEAIEGVIDFRGDLIDVSEF
jgi:hypothetical protein